MGWATRSNSHTFWWCNSITSEKRRNRWLYRYIIFYYLIWSSYHFFFRSNFFSIFRYPKALQLGVGERKLNKNTKGTLIGHCKKVGAPPKRRIGEFCVTPDALLPPGQKISVAHFVPGQLVDVSGITKGKGFQGRWVYIFIF